MMLNIKNEKSLRHYPAVPAQFVPCKVLSNLDVLRWLPGRILFPPSDRPLLAPSVVSLVVRPSPPKKKISPKDHLPDFRAQPTPKIEGRDSEPRQSTSNPRIANLSLQRPATHLPPAHPRQITVPADFKTDIQDGSPRCSDVSILLCQFPPPSKLWRQSSSPRDLGRCTHLEIPNCQTNLHCL